MKEAFELFDRAGSGRPPRPAPRARARAPLLPPQPCDFCLRLLRLSAHLAALVLVNAGKISAEDFGTVVRAVGHNPTEAELSEAGGGEKVRRSPSIAAQAALLRAPSLNRAAAQDLGAVTAFVKKMDDSKASKSDVESKIIDAFKVFDDGNTGKITGADLKHVMTSIGEKLTAEQADAMMTEADVDGGGKVDYEEFVKNMMGK